MIKLLVTLEWTMEPIYMESENYQDYINVNSLDIGHRLKEDIEFWNNIFQIGYNADYPPESGFTSEQANEVFFEALNIEGKYLCNRLQKELGTNYSVEYIDF